MLEPQRRCSYCTCCDWLSQTHCRLALERYNSLPYSRKIDNGSIWLTDVCFLSRLELFSMSDQGESRVPKRPRGNPHLAKGRSILLPQDNSSLPQSDVANPYLTPSASSYSQGPQAPPAGKIAIPALRSSAQRGAPAAGKKGRTTHACNHCRKAKAACTGEQPCLRCINSGTSCVYGDGKRDAERK